MRSERTDAARRHCSKSIVQSQRQQLLTTRFVCAHDYTISFMASRVMFVRSCVDLTTV